MNQWLAHNNFLQGPATSGNICAIYAVPVEWIHVFPDFDPATQYLKGDIVLKYEKYWIKFSVPGANKSFDEITKTLNGRTYWDQKLSFTLYSQSGNQDVRLGNMANHRWVFLFREGGTGIYYVVGKPAAGAELTIGYSNKSGTATDLTVQFRSIHRAPLYTGVNRALCRLIDDEGNFVVDGDGNYVTLLCDMVVPDNPAGGDFAGADFNTDFYVL